VVLPQKTTGYLIQVKPVGQRWISVILYFYEGKLIDIIRHKEHQNDKDQDEIIADLTREFGLLYPQKTTKGELLLSTIKTLKKSTQKEINKLSEQLFQSYIINSSFDESNLMNELLLTIQKRYNLKKFPYRIECIDISHLSG
jgi:excinuclease UvrABC nuclease subunit